MKNLIILLLMSLVSCRNDTVIKDVIFDGDLYAKNTIGVEFGTTMPDITTSFQWSVANTPSGEWNVLQGIHTQEIVLLMEYAGKYLKCEITARRNDEIVATAKIISKEPIADRGNPNTDWFKNEGLGLMVHFLKTVYTSGGSKEWNEIVDGFDVELFANQCSESGVKYVLWALGQNDGYYNSPNAAYDKITSVNAGDLCSRRDLPADLIQALKRKGIKLMFYLPGNPPINNEEVTRKFQYTYRKDSPTSQFTQQCWEAVIREWSLRYGKDLWGWWFDGMYRGGIIETRSDMSLEHNISTHTLAAKAGNRQSIVSYNYGVAKIQSDSPYDDYSAGEENNIIQLPESRWTIPGVQWFHFTHLGEFWARPGVKHTTAELEDWARKVYEKEGVLCFDVHVTGIGEIDPRQREQLRAIADIFQAVDIFKRVEPTTFRLEQREASWLVADRNGAIMDFVFLGDAGENELVTNSIDWINRYVRQQTNKEITVQSAKMERAVLYVGFGEEARKKLNHFRINVDPGPQGFVLKQAEVDGQQAMCCWSPTALGCRYGLIEFLRSLKTRDGVLVSDIKHVVDAPDFPVRIHYINNAEHLQNAYNANVFLETEINQWSLDDWERYIDMISAYRYNIFEFWLFPALLGRDDERKCEEFIKTINHVIAYAKRRGVSVHPIVTVNTLGGKWFYACPNDPEEKKQILEAWDFWTKSIQGNDSWGIFPGDPGGCIRNGCTKETFIDLSLELSALIRQNNPKARIEIGTWGEPFAGWGIPLWQGDPKLTERSMDYLLKKLPEFPPGTFVSINREFNPDADRDKNETTGGGRSGGDGRPYALRASASVPVLTWDFSVSEGENSVAPRCRVRRMIEVRKKELALGCYSGGICFTMAPQLQCLSAFCSAEVWWNPYREAEDILDDYGRWTFGEGNGKIGRLLEEFEVIPDWGYYAPFPYSAARLHDGMNSLLQELGQLDIKQSPRLPLSVDYASHVKSLEFFALLFRDLANVSLELDVLNAAFHNSSLAGESKDNISLAAVTDMLATKKEFKGRDALEASAKKLTSLDVHGLKQCYWDTVYGIYNHIPAQAEDRKPATIHNVFDRRFKASLAELCQGDGGIDIMSIPPSP